MAGRRRCGLLAGLNAAGQLFFPEAYPLWSVCMFAVSVVIIYALATYAGPQLRLTR
jgi:hypothetical protein